MELKNKTNNEWHIGLRQALDLYQSTPLPELMQIADTIRAEMHPDAKVSWIIDRNINTTNICSSACSFCKFYCAPKSKRAFVTTKDEYRKKINELFGLGGRQLLLQGGLNEKLNLDYYVDLFSFFKKEYPEIKIHALSPTEIQFLSQQSGLSIATVLKTLVDAGLDTLPGGGAEILSQNLRKKISPRKATVEQWLEVMRQAHLLDITTTATMMFAHLETPEERIQHLLLLRDLQNEKPDNAKGFISFIPWPFAPKNTALERQHPLGFFKSSASDYIRLIAVSRILLYNIPNIQASLLTVGKDVAQLCLHAGANDLGSLLLEENVISEHSRQAFISKEKMIKLIEESGFQAVERDQHFNFII